MSHSFATKVICVLLAALVSTTPMYGTCPRSPDAGGCAQLLYDNYFSDGCAWALDGDVQLNNSAAEFSGYGVAEQQISIPSGLTSTQLTVGIDVVPGAGAGTEYLNVTIVAGGNTVLDSIYPSDSDGLRTYYPGNYGGQTITVLFRYRLGVDPGDTVFRVYYAVFYAC